MRCRHEFAECAPPSRPYTSSAPSWRTTSTRKFQFSARVFPCQTAESSVRTWTTCFFVSASGANKPNQSPGLYICSDDITGHPKEDDDAIHQRLVTHAHEPQKWRYTTHRSHLVHD